MPENAGEDVLTFIVFPTINKGSKEKKEFTWEWLTTLSWERAGQFGNKLEKGLRLQMSGGCLHIPRKAVLGPEAPAAALQG